MLTYLLSSSGSFYNYFAAVDACRRFSFYFSVAFGWAACTQTQTANNNV